MLLINPPIVKPSEPPAGIAKLSGALCSADIKHYILDANIEGIYYLLNNTSKPTDTWTKRASRNLTRNIEELKKTGIYKSIDKYKRAVADINHILGHAVKKSSSRLSLSDYCHSRLSPVKSNDLIYAANNPEENPFYPYFSLRLSNIINGEDIRIAGFSINYLSQALTAFSMIGFLKMNFPRVKIITGGGLITSWMSNSGEKLHFGNLLDNCFAGAGEMPILELLGNKSLKKRHFRPSYDLFPINDYLSPGFVLPYNTSTGCYWSKCSFCPEKAEGNRYIQSSSDLVNNDLSYLTSRHKPSLIHITDNAISPLMMRKFIEQPPGVPWYGFSRVTENLTDSYFCEALKDSGCVMLKLGIESGDQRVLDYMNKGCYLKTASEVLQTIKKAGISTYIYLLFGTPSENITGARNTLEFINNHLDFIDFMNLAVFNLPVNSTEAREVGTVDFYEGDLSLYTDFRHPEGWDRRQVREFLNKEFKKNPGIQSIMRNQPTFFTSNHAPFFMMDYNNR